MLFNWSLTQENVVGCITDSVESGKYNLINFTAIQVRVLLHSGIAHFCGTLPSVL